MSWGALQVEDGGIKEVQTHVYSLATTLLSPHHAL